MTIAIAIANMTIGYNRHPAVHHLTMAVPAGALLAVAGPNGAGKSSLLKTLAGLEKQLEGDIVFTQCGPSLSPRSLSPRLLSSAVRQAKKATGATARPAQAAKQEKVTRGSFAIGYLPQVSEVDRLFPITVFEFVAFGLWRQIGAFGALGRDARDKILSLLVEFELDAMANRSLAELSGGQFRRAELARLTLMDAPLLLLDEPFNALDVTMAERLVQLVRRWHGQGKTILMAMHNQDFIKEFFPQTLLLAREVMAMGNSKKILTPANWEKAVHHLAQFSSAQVECRQ